MSHPIISPLADCRIQLDDKGGLIIPEDLTRPEFYEAYRRARRYKSWVKAWTRRLEEFGLAAYGLEEMQGMYEQLGMELGDDQTKPEGISVNASDKSTAIITIEGVAKQFEMWERKMRPEIPNWDSENLKRATELLKPIAAKWRELTQMLADKQGLE